MWSQIYILVSLVFPCEHRFLIEVQPKIAEAKPLSEQEPIIIFRMPKQEDELKEVVQPVEEVVPVPEPDDSELEPTPPPPLPPPPVEKETIDAELLLSQKREAQKVLFFLIYPRC